MLQYNNRTNITFKALIGGGGLLLALVLVPATDLAFAQTTSPIFGLTVTPASTGATVTWNQYQDHTNYVVVLLDGDGNKISGGVTRVTGLTHDITGLTSNTDYMVFVRTTGAGFVQSNSVSFSTIDFGFTNAISDITMNEAERKTIPLSVTPASDSVTYAITKQDGTAAPSFASIDSISFDGTITDGIVFTPDREDSGEYSLRLTATIGDGTATENFLLTVNDPGIDPPQIKAQTSTSVTIEIASEDINTQDSTCTFADIYPTSSGRSSVVSHGFTSNPLTITGLSPDTAYTIIVGKSCIPLGNLGILQFTTSGGSVGQSVQGNLRFTNTIKDITMAEGTTRHIKLNATDSDNRDITYSVDVLNDKTLPGSAGTSNGFLVLEPDRTAAGEYTLRVTATAGSDTKRDEFVLTVSDPGIDPPQIKTKNSTSVTIEVASEDYNTKDATCTTAGIFETSSGPSGAEIEDFESNPLTITGLTPDTAYTISVYKFCDPAGILGTLKFTTSGGRVAQSVQGDFRFTNTINDITMAEGTIHSIQLNAIDPDNRDITYSVEILNDKTLPGSLGIFNDNLLQLAPDRTAAGEYTLRVTATAGSDTIRDEFTLTVSDSGTSSLQIKTQTRTSVTVEVASADYNPQDATCIFADIYPTSSGPSSAVSHSFRTNPLTITGLSPDTAYTIIVGKECIPMGNLGTLQFNTSGNSQTSLVLSRTISGNDVTLSWNNLASTYVVVVFDGERDRVITGGSARVSTNSYTLNDLDADTYTAFVRTPGPSGTSTMSNTVTFTITS